MIKNFIQSITKEKQNYNFKPEILILFFGFIICITAWLTIPELRLFGHKSKSIFDTWTIVHIATGSVLGFFIINLRKNNIHNPVIFLLLISSTWEIIEHYLEIGGPTEIAKWFAGEETLLNRLIADQISLVLGFTLVKFKPGIFPIALIISLGIFILHIFLGNSMFFF